MDGLSTTDGVAAALSTEGEVDSAPELPARRSASFGTIWTLVMPASAAAAPAPAVSAAASGAALAEAAARGQSLRLQLLKKKKQ